MTVSDFGFFKIFLPFLGPPPTAYGGSLEKGKKSKKKKERKQQT